MTRGVIQQQLKAVKQREGFTYKDMGDALSVHWVTVARWCIGSHPPKGKLIHREIARFLKRHNGGA